MSNRVLSDFAKLTVVSMLAFTLAAAGCSNDKGLHIGSTGGMSSPTAGATGVAGGSDGATGGMTSATGGVASATGGFTGTMGGTWGRGTTLTSGTGGTGIATGGVTSGIICGSTDQDAGANDAATPSFEYLATDAFCDPNTLFRAIERLPGGCYFIPEGPCPLVIEVVLDGDGQVVSTTNLDSNVLPNDRWPCLAGQTVKFYCYFGES